MHDPIRENLEKYLERPDATGGEFRGHLEACRDCAEEVRRMSGNARTVRSLRAGEAEPVVGFYGRVRERIEGQARPSLWSLLESSFGRRIAVASATLALLMAGYIVSTEPGDRQPARTVVTWQPGAEASNSNAVQTDEDRDSVLVTLASYRE